MKTKSFTLIELLVVIVIIGILAGVIIVSVSSSINKANFAKAQSFSNTVQNELLGDLISEWTFDIASNPGEDTWGNNNGTVYGGVTYKTKADGVCVYGGCYEFNGTDGYINLGDNNSLNVGYGDYAFSLWFKKNSFGTVQVLLDKRASEYVGISLYFTSSNTLSFRSGEQGAPDLNFNKAVTDSGWHFVCVSNVRTGKRTIVLDGVSQSSVYDSSLINFDSTYSLKIGKHYSGELFYFKGSIDDVRIYDSALTSAQIKQQYVAGLDSLLSKNLISQEEYNQKLNSLAYEN